MSSLEWNPFYSVWNVIDLIKTHKIYVQSITNEQKKREREREGKRREKKKSVGTPLIYRSIHTTR